MGYTSKQSLTRLRKYLILCETSSRHYLFREHPRMSIDQISVHVQHGTPSPAHRKKRALITLLFILATPAALLVFLYSALSTKLLPVGITVPPLVLRTGENVLAKFEGKKSTVLFFTVECPHCKNQLASFHALASEFSSRVNFIAVSLSKSEKTTGFLADNTFPFPIVQGNKNVLEDSWSIPGVPALFLIDENGILKYRRLGETKLEEDRKLLQRFVSNTL